MWLHDVLSDQAVRSLIRSGNVVLAGNRRLGIFGSLNCASGKRLHRDNRIFFGSEQEARAEGYRPCGHCMRNEYQRWKHGSF
ncbi:MAG: metal-binding protein [Cyclobacteriaceae bacterium]|nr:metal-binding protein [Cyclobacteriaceae bacterium]